MKQQTLELLEWLWQVVIKLTQIVKKRYQIWCQKTYKPEQEQALELKRLTNQELKGIHGYIHWTTCMNLCTGMVLALLVFMVVCAIMAAFDTPGTVPVILAFMYLPLFMLFMLLVAVPDNARQCLRRFAPHIWDHPDVREARDRYKFFYITGKEIVFTNVKPFFLLYTYERQRADVDWRKYKNNRARAALDWAFMSTLYLRFIWPIVSWLQLAPLAYLRAMKQTRFEHGSRVLMIGAGPIPYHVWWKGRLGHEGSVVALDVDLYVNRTSFRIERGYEWIRGSLCAQRWVSSHVTGDSEELPFAEESFDIVVSIRCYHVNVKEALRVLKPGGKLLIDQFSQVAELDEETQQVDTSTSWWRITT